MGGGASIVENIKTEITIVDDKSVHDNFDNLKASSIEFNTAYKTIKEKYSATKSITTGSIDNKQDGKLSDDKLATIHFLAIRQLSHNLQNQDIIQKRQKKIITRSLPNIHNFVREECEDIFNPNIMINDDLGPEDLQLVHDDDFHNIVHSTKQDSSNIHNINTKDINDVADLTLSPQVLKPIVKKSKPNLSLQIHSTLESPTQSHQNENQKILLNDPQQHIWNGNMDNTTSPNASMYLSPEGTLYMGKLKVMETGIYPANSIKSSNNSKSNSIQSSSGSFRKIHTGLKQVPALGGKRDFIEINALGNGASGVVTEAIHLPSLTIVALKMLPVYNQEKRQHVSRELEVLYKNLSELQLVDDSLYAVESKSEEEGKSITGQLVGPGPNSPHIVSFYNAFVDPRSGLINLVIEYMDGGSLEDLVKQGGCSDERVLADIAYQTCKGLCFLHANKNVHRDIKPANILCSTSGLIKIADFGVAKALDKTTGFANSFIGTVCYMSPERIIGDTPYSFPCDIWSLGLTLLAVAKGRFPLSTREEKISNKSETATCSSTDDVSSTSDASIKSPQVVGGAIGYWAMIKAICDDDPPIAGPMFSKEFNEFIASCLCKEPSERLTARNLLQLPFIEHNVASIKLSHSDLQTKYFSINKIHENESNFKISKVSRDLHIDTNSNSYEEIPEIVPQSPLTNRLRKATINRNTSLDATNEFDLAASVYAIRLAHLERVLDRIVKKIDQSNSTCSNLDESDDMDDASDVYAYVHDDSVSLIPSNHQNLPMLVHQATDTSIDSLDKMLYYQDSSTSITTIPTKDNSNEYEHDDNKLLASEVDVHDVESKSNKAEYLIPVQYKMSSLIPDTAKELIRSPGVEDADSKHSTTHSILKKGLSSYKSEHLSSDFDDIGSFDSVPLTTVANSMSRNKGGSLSSANRSVHFSDSEDNINSPLNISKQQLHPRKTITTTSDQQKENSELLIDDVSKMKDSQSPVVLPKSSSYFIQTSSSSSSNDAKELSIHETTTHQLQSLSYDYRIVIPKLNNTGLKKWGNLAKQLHLPLSMVKLAVKSKLGAYLDLEEE